MILGGDLGGTKTLLALAEIVAGRPQIIRSQRYASADFADFDSLLADFLAGAPAVSAAAFGVAGPTDGRTAKLTYLPWRLDADALGRRFGLGRVSLLNDFAAAAHGLSALDADDLHCLHGGRPQAQAPRVIVGAGTGLGVAGLIHDGRTYRVIPGEGGHFGFSPQTAEQGELWQRLLAVNGRVTTEDIVSGPGLVRIFAHFPGRPQLPPEALPQPAEIAAMALAGSDERAVATLNLWLSCYGAFAGDLALHWLAHGGVFLAGGIAARLMPQLDPAPLVAAFLAKREHQPLVAAMPLHLVTAEDLGLRGALVCAAQAFSAVFPG